MADVEIRPFEAVDAEEVAALIRRTLFESNATDYSAEVLEMVADWYAPAPLVNRMDLANRFVASSAGEIVGTAARRENRVEGFFVRPDWQGRGVGRRLLVELELDARTDALRALWLESSLTAVAFYESQGFSTTTEPHDNGEGLVVQMRKSL